MKCFLLVATLATFAFGGDLPVPLQAKFVKLIAGTAGIRCGSAEMAEQIKAAGGSVNPGSKIAYASNEAEIASLKGNLIIVPKLEWLPKGGCLAIVEEAGKPAIYIHLGNYEKCGVTVPDAIVKIGKRL